MQNQYLIGEDCVFGPVVEGRIWVYRMLICIITRKRKCLKGILEAVEVEDWKRVALTSAD